MAGREWRPHACACFAYLFAPPPAFLSLTTTSDLAWKIAEYKTTSSESTKERMKENSLRGRGWAGELAPLLAC